MPARSEVDAQVAVRVLRDLDKEMKKAIVKDSKGIGQDLVSKIRSDPGVAPYGKVYDRLAQAAKVRTRAGRPPEVVIGGGRKFSGGGTITQLARPYEFGALTGDTKRGKGELRLSEEQRAGRQRRHRRKRPFPQFPPVAQDGHWLNEICRAYEKGPLLAEWLGIVDQVIGRVARENHG